jgi:uncharacterized protein (UPF0264 family)
MVSVVAGGLRAADFAAILAVDSDYVAVRGAACRGDRRGRLDARRVRELVEAAHGGAAAREISRR